MKKVLAIKTACRDLVQQQEHLNQHECNMRGTLLLLLLCNPFSCTLAVSKSHDPLVDAVATCWCNWSAGSCPLVTDLPRGGASAKRKPSEETKTFRMLAEAFQDRWMMLADSSDRPLDMNEIVKGLKTLAASQKTFKAFDGTAHELYQRTQDGNSVDLNVRGRAMRSVARVGVAINAMGACELCELVENPAVFDLESDNSTLAGKEVLFNRTGYKLGDEVISVLVIHDPSYNGTSGEGYGGIPKQGDVEKPPSPRGRLLVVFGDSCHHSLERSIRILDQEPKHTRMKDSLISDEIVSVQPVFYKTASIIYSDVKEILQQHNETAIHFTGRSLAGGVATLVAIITDGGLSPYAKNKKGHRRKTEMGDRTKGESTASLGRGRTSAVVLGAPPVISSNLKANYITSVIYGDDVIPRTSKASIDRFLRRAKGSLKPGFLGVGRQLSWMTDAVSLASSSLKDHAHGSEGEEGKLSIAGKGFLVRPRRLGDSCSIHEVGSQLKGGREALRAAVFWQLNDIMLSKSLWKHHQLDSYIHGIDRLHLRGLEGQGESEDE